MVPQQCCLQLRVHHEHRSVTVDMLALEPLVLDMSHRGINSGQARQFSIHIKGKCTEPRDIDALAETESLSKVLDSALPDDEELRGAF